MFKIIITSLLLLQNVYSQAPDIDIEKSYKLKQSIVEQIPTEFYAFHEIYEKAEWITPGTEFKNTYYSHGLDDDVAIVVLTGMGESGFKYFEMGIELSQVPAKTYFFDHLGHGYSSHLTPNDTQKVHIDSFESYTKSFSSFIRMLKNKHKKIYVIGHSMGGHIALRTTMEQPELIDRLVLLAPMIMLHESLFILNFIHEPLEKLGLTLTDYPPLTKFYKKDLKQWAKMTHSRKRADIINLIHQSYPGVYRHAVTMGWTLEALRSMQKVKSMGEQHLLKTPTLIIGAGEDKVVSTGAQERFCKRKAISNNKATCQFIRIPKSRHEMVYEKDSIRRAVNESLQRFLQLPKYETLSASKY